MLRDSSLSDPMLVAEQLANVKHQIDWLNSNLCWFPSLVISLLNLSALPQEADLQFVLNEH